MPFDFQNWMFGFVRAGGFLAMLPIFSAANVPVKLRILFAATLGLLVAPTIGASHEAPTLFSSIGQITSETLIGLALGFVARIVIGGIELAGQLVATELGLNMSSVLNPISTAPTQAPGMMLLLLATTLLFALIYKIIPRVRIRWSDVWIGAAVTALLFVLGKFLIGFYIGQSDPGSAYGAAGSLAVILVWIYYASMIVLFGAEFTQVYARSKGADIVPEPGAVRR